MTTEYPSAEILVALDRLRHEPDLAQRHARAWELLVQAGDLLFGLLAFAEVTTNLDVPSDSCFGDSAYCREPVY